MRKTLLALLAFATLAALAADALAHGRRHGHVRFGVYVGSPWYWGPYWGPAYYYPPPAYYYPPRPAEPTQYIERIDPAETGSWYYCEESRGYYPYVKECASGWTRVAPAPAAATRSAPVPPAAPVAPAAPVPPAAPVTPEAPS